MAGDELAGPQLRDDGPVQATLFEQVQASQVSVGVAQSGTTDQSVDFRVGVGGVGVVDGELDAFLEHHPQRERLVLGVKSVDQRRDAYLS